jgi:hypothetical protein
MCTASSSTGLAGPSSKCFCSAIRMLYSSTAMDAVSSSQGAGHHQEGQIFKVGPSTLLVIVYPAHSVRLNRTVCCLWHSNYPPRKYQPGRVSELRPVPEHITRPDYVNNRKSRSAPSVTSLPEVHSDEEVGSLTYRQSMWIQLLLFGFGICFKQFSQLPHVQPWSAAELPQQLEHNLVMCCCDMICWLQ